METNVSSGEISNNSPQLENASLDHGSPTSLDELGQEADDAEYAFGNGAEFSSSRFGIQSLGGRLPYHPSDPTLQLYKPGVKHKIGKVLTTQRFHVAIVLLVIVDCIVVISELLMDLRLLSLEAHGQGIINIESYNVVPDILHNISLALLSLFLLEMVVKLVVLGLALLTHRGELFDLVITFSAFILETIYQHQHNALNGFGLIIIFRLWRVSKILEGIVRSVKVRADRHLECERRRREDTEEELARLQQLCHTQDLYIGQLKKLLAEREDRLVPQE